jgi:hypothetical protein
MDICRAVGCGGSVRADIAFTATQKGMTAPWLGTWIITDPFGGTLASGSITSPGTSMAITGTFVLTGVETFGCLRNAFPGGFLGIGTDNIVIRGTCGTSSTIDFTSDFLEAGSFTGSTHCGFPGNH